MKKSMLHLVLDKALSTKRPHDTQQTRDFTLWLWDTNTLAIYFMDCYI